VFIGGGNMASALIGGRIAAGAKASDFGVVEPLSLQRDALRARFSGIHVSAKAAAEVIAGTSVVVLAVKPQQMQEAAMALAPHVRDVPVVLTIAAGIRTPDLSRWLGGYRRIVRAMPNTPALVGAGIRGGYAAAYVEAKVRDAAAASLRAACYVVGCGGERKARWGTGGSCS